MSPAVATTMRKVRPEPVVRTVERRTADGSVLDEVALAPEFFGIEPNAAVMHQVVTAQLAAARSGTQSTKTRSEVAGGGAKPFKQKGTGRSRQGSTRSPQWSGGGVALGPKPRSYRQRTPKKMIRLALCSALSDRAAEQRVALVDDWGFAAPRTKDAIAALDALGVEGKVLVVLRPEDLDAAFSFRNLPDVKIIAASELNTYDILRSDWVVFTTATVPGGAPEAPAAPVPAKKRAPAKAASKTTKATKAAKAAAAAAAPAAPDDEVSADDEPEAESDGGGDDQ